MAFEHVHIPYGAYWSTPFCRWQGSLSGHHSIELAGRVGREFLESGDIAPETFDGVVLGTTVTQRHDFYGAPWLAAMLGADRITGPTVSQACATSARLLASAALEVQTGQRECLLAVGCDRTSNGPHIYYPDPGGVGGQGRSEDPVLGNMDNDPHAGLAMVRTAENLAAEAGITRAEQDAVTVLRHAQYQDALAEDRAFQRRYMVAVELLSRRKVVGIVDADEGVHDTTADGLAALRPVTDGGTVTFGTQTHPADGNAGVVVCSRDRAAELEREPVPVRLVSYGEARVESGLMPKASVPAARDALGRAGITIEQCEAIKTHNPFAVADVFFCREMGVAPEAVNNYGSTLVWGHPQAPMGLRAVVELIEELVIAGGGYGLFSGCAGGDSAMAVVVEVG
ncbi:MAG: thiolase family protein [Acidimicrobiales bacterium]